MRQKEFLGEMIHGLRETALVRSSDPVGSAAEIVASGIGRIALGDMLRRSASRFGGKPAIVDQYRATSFDELHATSNQIAHWLLGMSLPDGSKVATFCGNSSSYFSIIYGINKAGLVWVPINIHLHPADVRHILRHCETTLLIADAELLPKISFAQDELGISTHIIDPASTTPFGTAVASGETSDPQIVVRERDLAMIMYTSGTTSRPKGVMHCHLGVYITLLNNIGEWSVTRDDSILVCLPLFHIAGHTMVSTLLMAGGTVILHPSFSAPAMVSAIQDHRVTMIFALPMMYEAMLEEKIRTSSDTSSLRFCIYAMAPMARTSLTALIDQFCPKFALTSGQTEIYPMTVMFRPEQQLQRFGNYWGESSVIDDTAIMGDSGELLAQGEVGEIVHRGPNVMLGYYKDEVATSEAQRFGWHHTGDLGYFDQDGQLVFADRKKDMIKTGGENVPSVVVEEVMLRHPDVAIAAAVGLPHPRWSEAIFVCVLRHAGSSLTEADLMEHARRHLGGFQIPKGFAILDDLPLTATGKPKKNELRDTFRTYFETFQS